jgi:hypothetical protein
MRKPLSGIPIPDPKQVQEQQLAYTDALDGGHYPDMNPAKIPPNGCSLLKNSVIRDGVIKRRPGTTIFSPAKPNSNKVLYVIDFVDNTGNLRIIRHTRNSLHYAGGAWTNVVGALTGTDSDQIRSFVVNYNYLFTNNGIDQIQLVDFTGNTFAALSATAPKVKRAFGFNHRIVGLNVLSGPAPYTVTNPVQVVWSGLDNYTQFDFAVDSSAGFKQLVDTPDDTSDSLVDGFGFDNVAILLRQHSVWFMLPQPISTDPFQIYCKYPKIGCVCDYGAADIDNGIIFPDLQHKDVYALQIEWNQNYQGYSIEGIASPAVKRFLMNNIRNPTKVFSSYDTIEKEYTLFVPSETSNQVNSYTFNFISKSWVYGEHDSVSCVMDVANMLGSRSIDELIGSIDGLTGSIDSLSSPTATLPVRLEGVLSGDILVVNPDIPIDVVYGATPSNFEQEIRGRTIDLPSQNEDVTCTHYTIKAYNVGTIIEEWSKDDGITWIVKKTFTITSGSLSKPKLLTFRRNLHTNRFMSRLRSSDVAFDLLDYEVLGTPGGEQT